MTQNWQINCGIFPTIYVCILRLGIGSVELALHVSGLGLDISGLVNISANRPYMYLKALKTNSLNVYIFQPSKIFPYHIVA